MKSTSSININDNRVHPSSVNLSRCLLNSAIRWTHRLPDWFTAGSTLMCHISGGARFAALMHQWQHYDLNYGGKRVMQAYPSHEASPLGSNSLKAATELSTQTREFIVLVHAKRHKSVKKFLSPNTSTVKHIQTNCCPRKYTGLCVSNTGCKAILHLDLLGCTTTSPAGLPCLLSKKTPGQFHNYPGLML